jgi:hypothetical protein
VHGFRKRSLFNRRDFFLNLRKPFNLFKKWRTKIAKKEDPPSQFGD